MCLGAGPDVFLFEDVIPGFMNSWHVEIPPPADFQISWPST